MSILLAILNSRQRDARRLGATGPGHGKDVARGAVTMPPAQRGTAGDGAKQVGLDQNTGPAKANLQGFNGLQDFRTPSTGGRNSEILPGLGNPTPSARGSGSDIGRTLELSRICLGGLHDPNKAGRRRRWRRTVPGRSRLNAHSSFDSSRFHARAVTTLADRMSVSAPSGRRRPLRRHGSAAAAQANANQRELGRRATECRSRTPIWGDARDAETEPRSITDATRPLARPNVAGRQRW